MSSFSTESNERVEQYAELYGLTLTKQLGFGNDGVVWSTLSRSVVKAIYRHDTFEREKAAYLRLFERDVKQLAGFQVPQLLNFHNALMVIEMQAVFPPYVIDFGKAYLDQLPDYPEGAMDEWMESRRELFDEDQWPQVLRLLAALRGLGIHYLDPTPANIRFPRS